MSVHQSPASERRLLDVALSALLFAALLATPASAQDPWEGTFRGDGLVLTLRATGDGQYRGNAVEDGTRYSVTGRVTGARMEGRYSLLLLRQSFVGELSGNRLRIVAEDETYELLRDGSPEADAVAARVQAEVAERADLERRANAGVAARWSPALTGQRLIRLTRSGDGTGGGQTRSTVTLCRDGRAGYQYQSSMAFNTSGGFGNASDRDEGEGRWEVVTLNSRPVLRMRLQDGRVLDWLLSMENERVHLDGRQYLREAAPC